MAMLDAADIPNLTQEQLYQFLHDEMGIPLGRNTIKWAVIRREIVPTRLGKANMFSRSDGVNWLLSQRAKSLNDSEQSGLRTQLSAAEKEAAKQERRRRNATKRQQRAAKELAEIDSALAELS